MEWIPILWKAFAKSRDMMDAWFLLGIALANRWSTSSRLSLANLPFLKPLFAVLDKFVV